MAIDASPTAFRLTLVPSDVFDPIARVGIASDPIAELVRRYGKHGAEIALRPAEPNAPNRAARRRAERISWSKNR